MTRKQKHFLMKTLPEFILREQGRGFAMDQWLEHVEPGTKYDVDNVERAIPSCGTVACIGGSSALLLKMRSRKTEKIAKRLGLSYQEAYGLFYNWLWSDAREPYVWPKSFRTRYANAVTARGKASVAAALCVLVGKTEGRCLHRSTQ